MKNSMVDLVKVWAKSVMSKNIEAGILLKNKFFTGSVLSVGVLKWQLLL